MKTKSFLFVLIILTGFYSGKTFAQTIAFCEDVKDDGQMVHHSTSFAISPKGGSIKMLVTLENQVKAEKIVYKVFRVSDKGDQTLDQTIEDKVMPDWMWFFHELFIRTPGNYLVFVYPDGATEALASGMVHIIPAPKN